MWDKFDPSEATFDKFIFSEESRKKYWDRSEMFWETLADAQPNKAHLAVAALERAGRLLAVVTQNIDGLHRKAGNAAERIIELHGTALSVSCLSCRKRWDRPEISRWIKGGNAAPRCDAPGCGGILKPDTVSFGQSMPVEAMEKAAEVTAGCDLFLVIGSSLVVYPAAQFPLMAKRQGARLVIINLTETPHDGYADLVIRSKAGDLMEQAVAGLNN